MLATSAAETFTPPVNKPAVGTTLARATTTRIANARDICVGRVTSEFANSSRFCKFEYFSL